MDLKNKNNVSYEFTSPERIIVSWKTTVFSFFSYYTVVSSGTQDQTDEVNEWNKKCRLYVKSYDLSISDQLNGTKKTVELNRCGLFNF